MIDVTKLCLDERTRDAIERHERIAFRFSGGKDSLAVLHLLQPYWGKILVLWADANDTPPETLARMLLFAQGLPNFRRVAGNAPKFIEENGYPVDLWSVRSSVVGRTIERHDDPVFVGWPACCGHNIWLPLDRAIREYGATLKLQGDRRDDLRRSPLFPGAVEDGFHYEFPIWEWSESDVLAYHRAHGIRLLPEYAEMKTSLDCLNCTAHIVDWDGRMKYLTRQHPKAAAEVRRRLGIIAAAARRDLDRLETEIAQAEALSPAANG